jgi:hypothetical protein
MRSDQAIEVSTTRPANLRNDSTISLSRRRVESEDGVGLQDPLQTDLPQRGIGARRIEASLQCG